MTLDVSTKYEETSFWARDYGPYTPNPSLLEPIQVDVAIVGGGFVGLNTAWQFKKDNPHARVAVLEGAVVGYGASGRNAGQRRPLLSAAACSASASTRRFRCSGTVSAALSR